jgi:pimeloyl-ACP methyl ester carboxylesterase
VAAPIRPPSRQAFWREGLTAVEPALLALNGFKLARQPRGDHRPVVVLPGFGASDMSTVPIRRYLRSIGYDARGWGLGQNTGDVASFVRTMIDQVARIAAEHRRPVPLVGWSLGGVIAREVARERPEIVEQVITFGSPIIGGPKYTRNSEAYRSRGVDLDAIEAQVAARNVRLIEVPITAIYSKTDGVVAWRACLDHVNPNVAHVEVRTTHLGLGIHHDVFAEVARRLSRPSARPRSA